LLVENYDGEPPNQEELTEWADEYGETFPVLSDVDQEVALRFARREQLSLPSHSLLAPNAVVLVADGEVESADIEAALP